MIGWLQLANEQRKAAIDQAGIESGIIAKAIEKDWWVTLTLKALFQSKYAEYMVFKGGTSLSKCWKLINRFSEDIDIALAPEAFGMVYKDNPGNSYVHKLKREGCEFTSTVLKAELEEQLATLGIPAGMVTVIAQPVKDGFPDTDPQTLFVKYPSLYEPSDYIADEVKVEVSVRSLKMPYRTAQVQSMLNEIRPLPVYNEVPFMVEAVEPVKTLLEKIFLLHEEFGKADTAKIRIQRMSRHLYDLVSIMQSSYVEQALADHQLYDNLVQHRQWYSRISWVDYQSLGHSTVSFIPPPELIEMYKEDYKKMQEQMIYGDTISFDDIIDQLKILRGRFRLKFEYHSLDEIIAKAVSQLEQKESLINDANYPVNVVYLTNAYAPPGPANKSVLYEVKLSYKQGKISFDDINVKVLKE